MHDSYKLNVVTTMMNCLHHTHISSWLRHLCLCML